MAIQPLTAASSPEVNNDTTLQVARLDVAGSSILSHTDTRYQPWSRNNAEATLTKQCDIYSRQRRSNIERVHAENEMFGLPVRSKTDAQYYKLEDHPKAMQPGVCSHDYQLSPNLDTKCHSENEMRISLDQNTRTRSPYRSVESVPHSLRPGGSRSMQYSKQPLPIKSTTLSTSKRGTLALQQQRPSHRRETENTSKQRPLTLQRTHKSPSSHDHRKCPPAHNVLSKELQSIIDARSHISATTTQRTLLARDEQYRYSPTKEDFIPLVDSTVLIRQKHESSEKLKKFKKQGTIQACARGFWKGLISAFRQPCHNLSHNQALETASEDESFIFKPITTRVSFDPTVQVPPSWRKTTKSRARIDTYSRVIIKPHSQVAIKSNQNTNQSPDRKPSSKYTFPDF